MTATKGFITGAATTALDTRKADGAKLVTNVDGTTRIGVLGPNPSIVTSDASTAPMRVAVAAAGFATQRAAGDGAAIWTNDGSIFLAVTKPVSNSWYVVIYAKHDDTTAGDGDNLPILTTVTGSAASIPVEPSIPAGATKIATVKIPSSATSTQSAGVVITNVYPMTAFAGGIVPFRTISDLNAWTTARTGQHGGVIGGADYKWDGSAWKIPLIQTSAPIGFTGLYSDSGAPPCQAVALQGRVHLEGLVVSTSASFVAGTIYTIGTVPDGFRPPVLTSFAATSNSTAVAEVAVATTGVITMRLNTSFTGTLRLSLAGGLWRQQ
jgi:hypothetical protein